MSIKLVTGMSTIKFGEFNYQHISEMYHMITGIVYSKIEGILHMVLTVLASGWNSF
jgi:hypothetical protein